MEFSSPFIERLVGGLVATGICSLVAMAYRHGIIQHWWDGLISKFEKFGGRERKNLIPNPKKYSPRLLRRLRLDQSRLGRHLGEFGKTSNPNSEGPYNPELSTPELDAKPRMYLTSWPVRVLTKNSRGPRMLRFAEKGIKRLLKNNRVYELRFLETHPTKRSTRIISYRHTICAVLIVRSIRGWTEQVRSVVDAMIDPRNEWQKADGGWAKCEGNDEQSDLWSSAYALRMLFEVIEDRDSFNTSTVELAESSIRKTIAFFKQDWEKNRWRFGEVVSEVNSVQIFIDIVVPLKRYEPGLLNEVVSTFRNWKSPEGNLSQSYLKTCGPTESGASLYARFAYALHLAGAPRDEWSHFMHESFRRYDEYLNSADVAFLLDLSLGIDIGDVTTPSMAKLQSQSLG